MHFILRTPFLTVLFTWVDFFEVKWCMQAILFLLCCKRLKLLLQQFLLNDFDIHFKQHYYIPLLNIFKTHEAHLHIISKTYMKLNIFLILAVFSKGELMTKNSILMDIIWKNSFYVMLVLPMCIFQRYFLSIKQQETNL